VLLIFGIIVCIAGFMGILACKIKHRCYTVTYGVLMLPTWIVVLAFGIIAAAVTRLSGTALENACADTIRQFNLGVTKINTATGTSTSTTGCPGYPTSFSVDLDVYSSILIETEMCSANCPCTNVNPNPWTGSVTKTPRIYNFAGSIQTYQECLR